MLIFLTSAVCAHAAEQLLDRAGYFSASYQEARAHFLAAARAAGGSLVSHSHPLAGPGGESLSMDVVSLGEAEAKTVLVLGSGIHGVEGFAGSAIQTGLLKENLGTHLPPGIRVLMIHAINPYGFAHLRRVNEDNVDLNRNFVDHTQPYPDNADYAALNDALAPQSISFWANTVARLRIYWYRLWNGADALQSAVSRGQYDFPDGLFFGGRTETWSNATLRSVIRQHLSDAQRVVVIDIHTGLGPFGSAEVISNDEKGSPAYLRAREWWGERVKATAAGESVSPHLYGTLKIALGAMLPNAEVTAVGLEFGTFPAMEVFWALRAENWLHHHGSIKDPASKEIKEALRRMFYPGSDDWKIQVWQQGEDVVMAALSALRMKG